MSNDDLLCFGARSNLFDSTDIERPILSVEAAHATHVVSVIRELVSCEAIFRGVRYGIGLIGKNVAVLALPAIGTAASREEQADVFHSCCVGAS